MKLYFNILVLSLLFCSCKNDTKKTETLVEEQIELKYSTTFQLYETENYKRIVVIKPWPDAEKELVYVCAKDKAKIPKNLKYDAFVQLPVQKIVLTSTTHIPSLISLNQLEKWVGFPGLDYVSSEAARTKIEAGHVTEIGQNEALNTEKLLELQPDVVVGFAVKGSNKSLNTVSKAGIPVLYNSDWLDEHPLGKAEWIKFFGVLTNSLPEAEKQFNSIEKNYNDLKKLAATSGSRPSVLAGAMYKDVWYLPGGKSWQAQFLKDANTNYVYADNSETGSLSKSFEAVLNKAQQTDFWVAPAQFTSYQQLLKSSVHYQKFTAFQDKKTYTFAKTKGKKGGVLYYELAPNRPDLVLQDLVGIFHPELLQVKEFSFFEALDE
ncbi:ABC transporter substrate-binding protein [Psychroflexus salis]|uniref:ABC transporter substrate-binding protein n=1 Tax=Psychroflexus salis TaxID=1526574 RepID=A0A916ZPP7_9FLAO|nr:ABC transporter substrate-binding protein [Psychroflexus salis]GGE07998.1 ABC transporter substrate-binding protein [Psychroflexus salis]